MDKNAIKKYAVWARRELIERVSQRAMIYGITAKDAGDPNAESVNGHLLSQSEKRQRQALIRNIKTKGYEQVMEEVAYTWFNRFAALRFMEVNGYLPSHIRVFTNDAGEFKPQILAEAIHLELDGLDMNKVYELESANKSEELFKYLLIVQCNALNSILPGMFQRIEDYTELLLPDYLLREGSVIEQMVTTIPEEDWTDQVQIIGWLYQYYNTEPKDKVFADLKKNIKITKENIPAATQLFTPDWIVHYMVENSLGRLWLEGHPNDALKSEWKYYLDEAEQEPKVQAQLAAIRKEYAALKPEVIRVIDPCMGSGHILCVLFDVLVRIYEEYGYTAREGAVKIVENNIWGLDIDERAAQLAYFAVMMKARQYDRRFFTRKVQPHVYAIEESNGITSAQMHDMGLNISQEEYGEAVKQALRLVEEMHDAKEYGSIIHVTPCDWDLLRRFAVPRDEDGQLHLDIHGEIEISARLQVLINIGEALAQKYHVVVTNPPYMAPTMKQKPYLTKHYLEGKNDLAMTFMMRNLEFCSDKGYTALINFPTWMFLSSYEKLRTNVIEQNTIVCMVYPGRGIFGSDFGSTCFVLNKFHVENYKGCYCKLFNAIGEVESSDERERSYLQRKGYCEFEQDNFKKIPGNPIAFWISKDFLNTFDSKKLSSYAVSKAGIVSGNDEYFLRMWFEINFQNITFDATDFSDQKRYKWVPINKGGAYRRHYGNFEYVINIYDLWNSPDKVNVSVRRSEPDYYFRKALTWSSATMGGSSFRFTQNTTSSTAAPNLFFSNDNYLYYALALLNSNIAQYYMDLLNPTVSLNVTNVSSVPAIGFEDHWKEVNPICRENIEEAKKDWDSFETSWNFTNHPLITCKIDSSIDSAYQEWKRKCNSRFNQIKANEELINKYIIEIYGLEKEVQTDVPASSVTVHYIIDDKKDISDEMKNSYFVLTKRDVIVSFISYAVGCMFGRFSLDVPGIIYAGGEWNDEKYVRYKPDKDAIIPICDDEYFNDDIVGLFVEFVEAVYGNKNLEDNLRFIAEAIGGKGTSREILRSYFNNSFFSDHCSLYSGTVGRRPIYWLFDSGKKNGFKCLIYMHRYQPDTIARIRTDYVHEQQSRYRTAIADLEQRINGASTSERVKLSKQLAKLQAQAEETRIYEEKIHHLADQMIKIDLDDGVKHNYAIFKDVLAKIK